MKTQRRVEQKEIISELGLRRVGGAGWYSTQSLECPDCNKGDEKFGILLKDDGGGLVNCWRCGYKDSIFNFLFKIGKQSLIYGGKKYEYVDELEDIITVKKPESARLPEEKLPRGFKEIAHHPYLEGRGFTARQMKQFRVGVTDSPLAASWNDKIIFQIFNHGVRVGYLGRSTKSKEWHDKNMLESREGGRLVLRYKNSDGDFNYMLGGLDDITDGTHTVIIVEGLFDKANLDNLLEAYKHQEIQVCYTFGSSISGAQIQLLRAKKGVQKVILMYDEDALKKMRGYVAELQKYFHFIMVAVLQGDIDPGEMLEQDLYQILEQNLYSPDEFYSSVLTIKKIRYED